MPESHKWLSHWLAQHPAKPVVNSTGDLAAAALDTPLFPMTVHAISAALHRLGKNALNKRAYPHLMRHSSATFWANKLPYFKFCKRFGWTMTSKMPQRYIDAAGVDEVDAARAYYETESERVKARREKEKFSNRLLFGA